MKYYLERVGQSMRKKTRSTTKRTSNNRTKILPKVSVIVPVYNSEQYLEQFLNSIINQTEKNIEIICIDDSSTDNSAQILENYKKQDKRITVVAQEHSGAGAARNKGISIAKGEYLAFLDSDDFFESDMLEVSCEQAKQRNADIVVFKHDYYNNMTSSYEESDQNIFDAVSAKNPFNAADISDKIFNLGSGWAWDKLYKRSFIEKNKLSFQELRTTNDMLFVFAAYIKAKKIYAVDKLFAHHRINVDNSLSVTREKSWDNFYIALLELKNYLIENNVYENFRQSFVNWALNFSLWNLNTLDENIRRQLEAKFRMEYFPKLDIVDNPEEYYYNSDEYKRLCEIIDSDKKPKVSVIIPVYNSEKYLAQCLDSVVSQTLKEIQIICVDDGSSDSSLSILNEYARSDERIIIVSKEHKNAGEARNAGLEFAEGEYLSFLDSDDFFESDMLERAYEAAVSPNVDICLFRCNQYNNENGKFYDCPWTLAREKMSVFDLFSIEEVQDIIFNFGSCTAWDKLFKRELIINNNIRFQSLAICNDMLFTYSAYTKAQTFSLIDDVLVHQRINHKKYLAEGSENIHSAFYESLMALKQFMINNGNYETFKRSFVNRAIDISLWHMHHISGNFGELIRQQLKRSYFEDLDIYGNDKDYFYNESLYNEMMEIMSEKEDISTGAPEISAVIPVYNNVEKYISLCMDSVVNQTFENIEIICVNCSSDNSSINIVKEYATKDNRIKLIGETGLSYGSAINTGIKTAKGKYIVIVNPADFVDVHMFEELYNTADSNDLDMVKADFYKFSHNEYKDMILSYFNMSNDKDDYHIVKDVCNGTTAFGYTPDIYSGIYKKSFIIKNNIKFNEADGILFRDHGFWFNTLCCAQRAMFVDKAYYMKRRDNIELSLSSLENAEKIFEEYKFIENSIINKDKFTGLYNFCRFRNYMSVYEALDNTYKTEFVKAFSEEFVKASRNNEIDTSLFSKSERKNLSAIISNPGAFVEYDLSDNIALSVVIPVFNAEEFLRECLDSVLNQTLQDIEVICVDDCSTDGSYEILKEYEAKDSRITVLQNKVSLKAGESRNRGLAIAKGEYVHFLDADDFLILDAYERIYNAAKEHNADWIKARTYKYNNMTKSIEPNAWFELTSIDIKDFNRTLSFANDYETILKCSVAPWNGIYRREYLIENGCHFNNLMCVNDRSFFINSLIYAKNICLYDGFILYYRTNLKNSLISNRLRYFDCHFKSTNLITDMSRELPLKMRKYIISKEYWDTITWFKKYRDEHFLKLFYPMKEFFKNIDPEYFEGDLEKQDWYKQNLDLINLSAAEYAYKHKIKYIAQEKDITEEKISENIKVSVIIPVFNAEKWLHQCIDSVLNQSLKELELICIDDNSTDESLKILAEYADKDSRVKVFHVDENQGPALARNKGLAVAKGEFLSFLDADDFFDTSMLETMYNTAINKDLDVVICRALSYNDKTHKNEKMDWAYRMQFVPDKEIFSYKDMPDYILNFVVGWAWDKLIKRQMVLDNGLYYQNIRRNEDVVFTNMSLVCAKRMTLLNNNFIYHRVNSGTSQQDTYQSSPYDFYNAAMELKRQLTEKGVFQEVKRSFANRSLTAIITHIKLIENSDCYDEVYLKLREHIFDDLEVSGHKKDYFYKYNQDFYKKYCEIKNKPLHEVYYEKLVWNRKERNRLETLVKKLEKDKEQLRKANKELQKQVDEKLDIKDSIKSILKKVSYIESNSDLELHSLSDIRKTLADSDDIKVQHKN